LLDYAWTTLQRFSNIPDTTQRVLSGGVVKRFEGRLRNVQHYLNKLAESKKSLPQKVSCTRNLPSPSWGFILSLQKVINAAEAKGRPALTPEYVKKATDSLVAATVICLRNYMIMTQTPLQRMALPSCALVTFELCIGHF